MFGGRFLRVATVVLIFTASLVAAATANAAPAHHPLMLQGPTGEWGDAPEGPTVNAYPFLGFVPASFPTCMTVGPATWIYHASPLAWFGPAMDPEIEGNAGLCPAFPPYDFDECFLDGDAGLITPGPFTIAGGPLAEVTCPGSPGTALGPACTVAAWGPNVDILVTNPSQLQAFVNVLIDWDQSASWGGVSPCSTGPAPEWVLVNFPVPPGFVGSLSLLAPPPFLIGPNNRFVWARFTISLEPILLTDWDGSGQFQAGETEDYLLRIDFPLAVTVDDFAARAENDHFVVSWRTVSEIDNTGFNLWRSETADGARALVTYVPSQSPGATAGADYQVVDAAVQAGQTYWFWLEDVDVNGATTLHGPVSATVLAPTAVDLAGMTAQADGPVVPLPAWGIVFAGVAALAGAFSARRRNSAR